MHDFQQIQRVHKVKLASQQPVAPEPNPNQIQQVEEQKNASEQANDSSWESIDNDTENINDSVNVSV